MLPAQARRLTQLPFGGDLDQLVGDLANAAFMRALRACQAPPPDRSGLDVGLLRPVAGEQFDVLDRQEQLVAAGIVELKAIVRRAGGFDGAQAHEAAYPVIDMHDQVTGREARRLGDEVFRRCDTRRGRTRRSPRMSCSPMTSSLDGLEAAFEPEHRERDLRLGQCQRFLP